MLVFIPYSTILTMRAILRGRYFNSLFSISDADHDVYDIYADNSSIN